uniref:Uncharacterized protein n=1 Tax=Prymnesium polylepis TaxID=72548 RepID=A0A6T8CQ01_9EUKA|mmetsp:Transcript_3169/g.8208  ORF Transcript_3169/g.8208 Transcript_3169/m.8208 type:complete len:183 (+) Transcript_3169:55-603(+)
MSERMSKMPKRPVGLNFLDLSSPRDAASDDQPTPVTSRDPAAAVTQCLSPLELAQGLLAGVETPARPAEPVEPSPVGSPAAVAASGSAASGSAACSSTPAPIVTSEEAQPYAPLSPAHSCPAMQRLLQSSPGTPDRLESIDQLLESLSALKQLPPYRAVDESATVASAKKRKAVTDTLEIVA